MQRNTLNRETESCLLRIVNSSVSLLLDNIVGPTNFDELTMDKVWWVEIFDHFDGKDTVPRPGFKFKTLLVQR